jgi:hypothetical protein
MALCKHQVFTPASAAVSQSSQGSVDMSSIFDSLGLFIIYLFIYFFARESEREANAITGEGLGKTVYYFSLT